MAVKVPVLRGQFTVHALITDARSKTPYSAMYDKKSWLNQDIFVFEG